jgi:lipoprotein-anchoring transpeptidase ErfK/SrfK
MRLPRRWMYFAVAPVIAAAAPGGMWLLSTREDPKTAADKATLRIQVDLTDKRMKMFEADTLVWQYPISDGKEGYPTPPGTYTIRRLTWNPRWTPPPNSKWAQKYTPKPPGHPANPMQVAKIFFREPDYYIHGTTETGRLGSAASHGCLRMDPDHIAEVAQYIMEHGGQPRDPSWFERVRRFRSEEKNIYLKRPVSLIVRR